MSELKNPVVASLANRSRNPYSSIAMSPNRQNAVVAGKDTICVLSVGPGGLSEIRSQRIAQHFQTAVSAATDTPARSKAGRAVGDVRDTFGLTKNPPQSTPNMTVSIEDVAWSLPQKRLDSAESAVSSEEANKGTDLEDEDSLVAAAGSNGVVVVYNSRLAFLEGRASSMVHPQAVLSQHTRAVNRLAWHPTGKYPSYLLTASQDATIKLWERKVAPQSAAAAQRRAAGRKKSWFGVHVDYPASSAKRYSWQCKASFEPRSEAVRDVRWSPFFDDLFAVVTGSGYLIVYNINLPKTAVVRITAHSGDASTLDWHPTRKYVIATGGATDRNVKIWDLESKLSLERFEDKQASQNANTAKSDTSLGDYIATDGSDQEAANRTIPGPRNFASVESAGSGLLRNYSSHGTGTMSSLSRHAKTAVALHVLSISASVTRLLWRPPAFLYSMGEKSSSAADPHDGMIAVATAPIKGASAGGNGLMSLWSHHRPFMPLSVIEGHQEGSVTGFAWVDTPRTQSAESGTISRGTGSVVSRMNAPPASSPPKDTDALLPTTSGTIRKTLSASSLSMLRGLSDDPSRSGREEVNRLDGNIWQHVLSVGRDGRCLLQSFARGERPISRVPPSCFAMANLSPFQSGFGSLQFFCVHQPVPSGKANDFALTGLRQDEATSIAPGVFREVASGSEVKSQSVPPHDVVAGRPHPVTPVQLIFNVVDQGDLDENGVPLSSPSRIAVAAEVMHLSRFAESYKLHPDDVCPKRVDLCLHNGDVAERLRCGPLARMWRMVATILKGSGSDELPRPGSTPRNALQFTLLPTIKSLLEERADAGDVQTCVVLCEIFQVFQGSLENGNTTRIPGLSLTRVREWYLSYIDLLQQMCLFSHASFLMQNCSDSVVGALNQQSTTIHESCPHCRKPLPGGGAVDQTTGRGDPHDFTARRTCNSCRRRIGMCSICHEPVRGLYLWCPGCGHGGHLDHVLEWFGGVGGGTIREFCPTGCGHRCNFTQELSAFPRTESLLRMESG